MASLRRLALALVTPLVVTLTITAPAAAQSTYTWANSGDSAWLTPGNWNPPTSFPGTTNNSGYVVASTGSTISISANITDGGTSRGITVPGGGTVILSGANTYSGTTLVTGGTLQVANSAGSATGSGMVGVASPARLSGTG